MSRCWYSHGALHFCDYSLSCHYRELRCSPRFGNQSAILCLGQERNALQRLHFTVNIQNIRFLTGLMSASLKLCIQILCRLHNERNPQFLVFEEPGAPLAAVWQLKVTFDNWKHFIRWLILRQNGGEGDWDLTRSAMEEINVCYFWWVWSV